MNVSIPASVRVADLSAALAPLGLRPKSNLRGHIGFEPIRPRIPTVSQFDVGYPSGSDWYSVRLSARSAAEALEIAASVLGTATGLSVTPADQCHSLTCSICGAAALERTSFAPLVDAYERSRPACIACGAAEARIPNPLVMAAECPVCGAVVARQYDRALMHAFGGAK